MFVAKPSQNGEISVFLEIIHTLRIKFLKRDPKSNKIDKNQKLVQNYDKIRLTLVEIDK